MSEIKLRRQSSQEDRYSLHLGQQVIICGITKRDADGICSTYGGCSFHVPRIAGANNQLQLPLFRVLLSRTRRSHLPRDTY